jgi:thiamine monophosphate kinase
MAPGDDGQMYRWAIEWAAAAALERDGVSSRDVLRPGDVVIVTGAPGRNPADHKIRLKTIERPRDGWKWGGKYD